MTNTDTTMGNERALTSNGTCNAGHTNATNTYGKGSTNKKLITKHNETATANDNTRPGGQQHTRVL